MGHGKFDHDMWQNLRGEYLFFLLGIESLLRTIVDFINSYC